MRTNLTSAKSFSATLGVLCLLGSSGAVAVAAEPPKAAAPTTASAPATSAPVVAPTTVVVPAPAAPASTNATVVVPAVVAPAAAPAAAPAPAPAAAPATAAAPPADASASSAPGSTAVTEIGIQRLPGSAYPEPVTRGLRHGSLWLTFHGMQWPYMPGNGKSGMTIGVSGWGWVDTAYEKFGPWGANSAIDQSRIKYWKQQSRLLLRVTPTYSFDDGVFLQGQAEFVATGDQTIQRSDVGGADTDDLWLRVGKWGSWDLQVGRFEGWEVFHLGMGLDQNTFERRGAVGVGESANNIQFYGLTDNQFRPAGPAGNFAFHYYPLPYLRFEVLGMAGSFSSPVLATRPVAILDLGWLKFKVGTEYQKIVGQQAQDQTRVISKGVGGALQFVFDPHIEFGLNAAQGTVVSRDSAGRQDLKATLTRTSFGGFANVSNGSRRHPVIFGVGSIFTRNVDQNNILSNGVVDNFWHYQGFAAVQYVIRDAFYVKLVGGYARAHWLTAGNDPAVEFDDEMYSVRLRLSYYF